jgi:hypothetical protein
MNPDKYQRIFGVLASSGPEYQVDTFDNLSADYDFASMHDVDAILTLEVGENVSDGFAIWTRLA